MCFSTYGENSWKGAAASIMFHSSLFSAKRISFYLLAAVAVLFPLSSHAATLSLSPAAGNYNTGDVFTVALVLDTEGQGIDGVDVHLGYDLGRMQIQDDNPTKEGTQIMPGTLMPGTPDNRVDTAAGKVIFSQITQGGSKFSTTGAMPLATLRVRAIAPGRASLAYIFTPGVTTDSNVANVGQDVLSSVTNASFVFSGSPLTTPVSLGSSYQFVRNLKLGMMGEDVKRLQQFLNARGLIIAPSGAGSPGNETTYFGGRTHSALVRFQEQYAEEILVPVRLSRGSGYFGSGTRAKINALLAGGGSQTTSGNAQTIQMLQDQIRALQEQIQKLLGN